MVAPEYVGIDEDTIELEDIASEAEDKESAPSVVFEISTYPADFTLEVLHNKIERRDIEIPPFQRRKVWKMSQAARLIDSFLLGLPVPQIFIYTDSKKKLLVIDGQQRLNAINSFFKGYFGEADKLGKRREFRLISSDEKSRWFKKTYGELDESDQRKLQDSVLRAIVVQQLEPKDNTSVHYIFERLNTGGTPLKDQEVRNCVYSGKLNDLLIELNRYENWRTIVGKAKEDERQRDVELILRFVALAHNAKNYEKPMKEFLSNFMATHRNPNTEGLNTEARTFKETCDLVINKLGPKPFHLRNGLNAGVFDSVFLAFSRHRDSCPEDIGAKFEALKINPEFEDATQRATTDTKVVKARLAKAEQVLFG